MPYRKLVKHLSRPDEAMERSREIRHDQSGSYWGGDIRGPHDIISEGNDVALADMQAVWCRRAST